MLVSKLLTRRRLFMFSEVFHSSLLLDVGEWCVLLAYQLLWHFLEGGGGVVRYTALFRNVRTICILLFHPSDPYTRDMLIVVFEKEQGVSFLTFEGVSLTHGRRAVVLSPPPCEVEIVPPYAHLNNSLQASDTLQMMMIHCVWSFLVS